MMIKCHLQWMLYDFLADFEEVSFYREAPWWSWSKNCTIHHHWHVSTQRRYQKLELKCMYIVWTCLRIIFCWILLIQINIFFIKLSYWRCLRYVHTCTVQRCFLVHSASGTSYSFTVLRFAVGSMWLFKIGHYWNNITVLPRLGFFYLFLHFFATLNFQFSVK